MSLIFNVSSTPNFRSEARNVIVEVPRIVNLKHNVSQTPGALIAPWAFERADTEAVAQKQALVEGG